MQIRGIPNGASLRRYGNRAEIRTRDMKGLVMALPTIGWKRLAAAVAIALTATPSNAGVVDGVKTVDDLKIYLGVLPAGLVRGHEAELATAVQRGLPRSSVHNIHVLAAVFDKNTGARLNGIRVNARIHGTNQNRWTVRLKPMIVNNALTYGGFTNLGAEEDVMISIDVMRPNRKHVTTAQFEYTHD